MGISLPNKPGHMAKVYAESDVNGKCDVFLDVSFISMTLLLLPKQYT